MYNEISANKAKSVLLIFLFMVFVIVVGYIIGYSQGYGYYGVIFAAVFSVISAFSGYYGCEKVALAASKAKRITRKEMPDLWNVVENLSITAGIPMPKVHVIEDGALNAFATGRDPEHASIAVTTGLLKTMTKPELEGVIAHELSHVRNYDIRMMTLVVVFVGTITLISDIFMRSLWWGGGNRKGNGGGAMIVVAIVLAILSPVIATLIKLAVSRKREFLADASGALLTRYPEGLASALEKIDKSSQTLKTANHATAHLFISNPFRRQHFKKLFSTHPPAKDRIQILRGMIG